MEINSNQYRFIEISQAIILHTISSIAKFSSI